MSETIAYPTLSQVKSALFIQPHPDDNEIGAGGTIALLRKKGIKVYGLTVTRGEGGCSDPQISADEITAIRALEANEAMRQLDVLNLGNLGYDELSTIPHEKLVAEIVSILREIKVDAVFTVDPQLKNEWHPTHIQVGNAVCEAFMRCGIIHFPPSHKMHENAYTLKMMGFYLTNEATTVVDISSVIDKKINAIKAHESQVNDSLLGAIYDLAEINAVGFNFKYAEPLRLCDAMHTHCFAVPANILKNRHVAVYP